jgi:NAD(P)-dependent dehydrogenase (short-subunit alcohol dehydrogenase family)
MKVYILGDRSDIAQGLRTLLEADGHEVFGWHRGEEFKVTNWNLIISALGTVSPVGLWNKHVPYDKPDPWEETFQSNLLLPVKLLRQLWDSRINNPQVCFLAGSNPKKIMPGYAAYNASKMALLNVVEQMDFETPECKFFALGPGYMDTKIHKPTLDANWPNERIARGKPNSVEQVYDCLNWCLDQPKEVVGGRNICVSDPYGPELAERLKADSNLYKLRRAE